MSKHENEAGGVGSSFDDFLKDEGILEEVTELAVKRVLAYQLAEEMKARKITKAALARQMQTSRSQVDRLLDPEHEGVNLGTIIKAARVVGRRLELQLV